MLDNSSYWSLAFFFAANVQSQITGLVIESSMFGEELSFLNTYGLCLFLLQSYYSCGISDDSAVAVY